MRYLFGYYWRDSDSGLARKISPTPDEHDRPVWVPQERTTEFRKLTYKVKGVPEHPRRCIFTVEGWLLNTADFTTANFREAKFGVDYI